MIQKRTDEISRSDIDALIASARVEDRQIEYKQQLPGSSDEEKREFLADVSAFANGLGGDILYGIDEVAGVPTAARGLPIVDFDAERLRLQNLIRDAIQPRLPALDIRTIDGFSEGPVVLIRIHQSWRSPHMVTFRGLTRFYVRDAGQRHQMDVQELRAAFVATEAIAEKLRTFRDSRLAHILAGDAPVKLWPHPTFVMHLLPVKSDLASAQFDPRNVGDHWRNLMSIDFIEAPTTRTNLDGFLIYASPMYVDKPQSRSYIQVFRNASIEAVITLSRGTEPITQVAGTDFEKTAVDLLESLRTFRAAVGIQAPFVVAVTLLRYEAVALYPGEPGMTFPRYYDRPMLLLPDVLIDDATTNVAMALRPLFDVAWQAAGFNGSPNFDANGEWQPPKSRSR